MRVVRIVEEGLKHGNDGTLETSANESRQEKKEGEDIYEPYLQALVAARSHSLLPSARLYLCERVACCMVLKDLMI